MWNIFCALSLLVLASSVTLWVRSYYVDEFITRITRFTPAPRHRPSVVYDEEIVGWHRGAAYLLCQRFKHSGYTKRVSEWYYSRHPSGAVLAVSMPYEGINGGLLGFQFFHGVSPSAPNMTSNLLVAF